MEFSADQKIGTVDEISEATSIPTGGFSGKVEPTIKYAQGMGLVDVERSSEVGYSIRLTALGREVFEQDKYLKEEVTQWLLHLMFCRRQGGAEAWYRIFGEGHLPLGRTFSRDDIASFLNTSNNNVSPLLRMYSNASGLALCNVLVEKNGIINRNIAPMRSDFYYCYAFFFLFSWEEHFPNDQQVSISDFNERTKTFAILGYKEAEINVFLDWMSDNELCKIDRQTGGAVLLKTASADTVISHLYDNLV
jgi:hypothetical protein